MKTLLKLVLTLCLLPSFALAQDDISISTGIIGNCRLLGAKTCDNQSTVGILGIDSSGNTVLRTASTSNFVSLASLKLSDAVSRIIPGTTSLELRNNANSAANLTISNAGYVTVRNGAGAGLNVPQPSTFGGTTTTFTNADAVNAASSAYFPADITTNTNVSILARGAAATGNQLQFFKTRATANLEGSTIVNASDNIASLQFWGANGTGYTRAAQINVAVDGTPGASADMPGSIDFLLSPDGSGTVASVLKLSNTKAAVFTGAVTSTATGTLGWTVVNVANQACTTTCTNACVIGIDTLGTGGFLDCATATADSCICAGAS